MNNCKIILIYRRTLNGRTRVSHGSNYRMAGSGLPSLRFSASNKEPRLMAGDLFSKGPNVYPSTRTQKDGMDGKGFGTKREKVPRPCLFPIPSPQKITLQISKKNSPIASCKKERIYRYCVNIEKPIVSICESPITTSLSVLSCITL